MNLNLLPLGPIAPGGTVFQVVGRDETLWLASPAGVFQFRPPTSVPPLEGGVRGGQTPTWRAVRRGIPFWRINAILAAGNSLWVAGMPGGIIRSPDRGRSWHPCWTDQVEAPIVSLAASPNYIRDRVLLAGTDGDGLLRSIDGGRYWELSNFGLRDFSVFNLAVAPVWDRYEYAFAVTESSVYQSPNGGRAWRRAELEVEVQPSVIAVSPNFGTDQTVFVGSGTGELLVSTDAGRSYHLAATGFEAIEALTFTAQGSLLVGTPEGICRFESEAVTTRCLNPCPPAPLPSPVIGLNTLGNSLYAALAEGLAYSSDDGQTWQPVSGLSARRFLWCLTPAPHLWLAGGPEEGVWRSKDKGQSWQQIWAETPVLALTATATEPLPPPSGEPLLPSPFGGPGRPTPELTTQIWISVPTGIATSTDAGATWATTPSPLPPSSETLITALAILSPPVSPPPAAAAGASSLGSRGVAGLGGVLWAGSYDSRLWRRSDGDWLTVPTPFTGSQMLGIFVQAATPTPLNPSEDAPAAATDGGSPLSPPSKEGLGGLSTSPPSKGGLGGVLVAVWQADKVTLWRSEDEGKTWSKWFSAPSRAVTPQVVFADAAGSEALVGLETDIYHLLPDGQWQRHKLTSLEAPITALLPLADHTLAALTDRLVASTPDGGWTPVETEVNGNPIAALAQSGEQLIILTSDGHIWTH